MTATVSYSPWLDLAHVRRVSLWSARERITLAATAGGLLLAGVLRRGR